MGRFVMGGDGSEADTELSLRTGSDGGRGFLPHGAADPHPLTIFYGGRVCVCDVTEAHARAIFLAAAQRGAPMGGGAEAAPPPAPRDPQGGAAVEQGLPPLPPAQQQQLRRSLSMRVSLQRFLHKRKARAAFDDGAGQAHPYERPHDHHRRHLHHQQQLQRQASFWL